MSKSYDRIIQAFNDYDNKINNLDSEIAELTRKVMGLDAEYRNLIIMADDQAVLAGTKAKNLRVELEEKKIERLYLNDQKINLKMDSFMFDLREKIFQEFQDEIISLEKKNDFLIAEIYKLYEKIIEMKKEIRCNNEEMENITICNREVQTIWGKYNASKYFLRRKFNRLDDLEAYENNKYISKKEMEWRNKMLAVSMRGQNSLSVDLQGEQNENSENSEIEEVKTNGNENLSEMQS